MSSKLYPTILSYTVSKWVVFSDTVYSYVKYWTRGQYVADVTQTKCQSEHVYNSFTSSTAAVYMMKKSNCELWAGITPTSYSESCRRYMNTGRCGHVEQLNGLLYQNSWILF